MFDPMFYVSALLDELAELLKLHVQPKADEEGSWRACPRRRRAACSHLFARSLFAAIWLWSPQQPFLLRGGVAGGTPFLFTPALPGGREEFLIFASLVTGSRY